MSAGILSPREALGYWAILLALGAGWGLTNPMAKIAVSTGHGQFGLVFWQLVIGAAIMTGLLVARRTALPLTPPALSLYAIIALIGTVIPNSASYQAYMHLPAGVMSILLSLVPMMAFPIALALRLERFRARRLMGLAAGLAGVLLLVLPEASLPDRAMLAWIPVALVAPLCYAFEGNFVARWGTAGLDPFQLLCGASILGAVMALPLALASGQFISPMRAYGAPEWALVLSSIIHVLTYTGYVWLVGRAGPVFTAQVGYLVTGFGVAWAITLLGESYSPYIWAAMALVLTGVVLVRPGRQDALAGPGPINDTLR